MRSAVSAVRRSVLTSRNGCRTSEFNAYPSSSLSVGTRSGFHSSVGGGASSSGSSCSIATVISLPDTPSMAAWWTLVSMATWPCSKPSMAQHSHSGRLRSRWIDTNMLTSVGQLASPAGRRYGDVAQVVLEVEVGILDPQAGGAGPSGPRPGVDGTVPPDGGGTRRTPACRPSRTHLRALTGRGS